MARLLKPCRAADTWSLCAAGASASPSFRFAAIRIWPPGIWPGPAGLAAADLETATNAFGENHPDVARDCATLAEMMREEGDEVAAHVYDSRAPAVRLALASQRESAIDSSLVGMET